MVFFSDSLFLSLEEETLQSDKNCTTKHPAINHVVEFTRFSSAKHKVP